MKKPQAFWDAYSELELFSETFKDFFERAVSFDPAERPTLTELLAHPWLNEDTASLEDIQAYEDEYFNKMDDNARQDLETKRLNRHKRYRMRMQASAECIDEGTDYGTWRERWKDLVVQRFDLRSMT